MVSHTQKKHFFEYVKQWTQFFTKWLISLPDVSTFFFWISSNCKKRNLGVPCQLHNNGIALNRYLSIHKQRHDSANKSPDLKLIFIPFIVPSYKSRTCQSNNGWLDIKEVLYNGNVYKFVCSTVSFTYNKFEFYI